MHQRKLVFSFFLKTIWVDERQPLVVSSVKGNVVFSRMFFTISQTDKIDFLVGRFQQHPTPLPVHSIPLLLRIQQWCNWLCTLFSENPSNGLFSKSSSLWVSLPKGPLHEHASCFSYIHLRLFPSSCLCFTNLCLIILVSIIIPVAQIGRAIQAGH